MSLVVHLPEELARRVEAVAAGRDQSPEQVAIDAIEAQLPARRRLSFSGVGSSGASGGDIGRRHREVVADHFADKTARDVAATATSTTSIGLRPPPGEVFPVSPLPAGAL